MLYRLHLRVPQAYVDQIRDRYDQRTLLEDVRRRVEAGGTRDVLVVMQDPSDNTHLTTLARAAGRTSADPVRIERVEITEDFPPPFGAIPCPHELDPGLTEDERRAVHMALRDEDNPRHLEGFASTLDPWFPVSTSLLLAKKRRINVYEQPSPYEHPEACDPGEVRRERAKLLALVRRRRTPLDLAQDEVRRVACFLATEPPPERVREHLQTERIPREVLDLAMTTVRRGDSGLPVVDAHAMRLACPPTGEEGFVSPSAGWLALSVGKPEISRVESRAEARALLADLEHGRGADPHATMRARASMERATRALERARWTEWYRRRLETS